MTQLKFRPSYLTPKNSARIYFLILLSFGKPRLQLFVGDRIYGIPTWVLAQETGSVNVC